MPSTQTFPYNLYFDTKIFCFQLSWLSPGMLKIQAIKKSQTSKCYRGEIKGEDKKSLQQIKRLYQQMEVKLAQTQRDKTDYLSSVITVIDRSDQLVAEFRLRIMIVQKDKTDIKEVPMKMQIVGENYFILKKVERLEHEKTLDRNALVEVWQQKQNNTQKIDEIKQQMQQMNLNKQLQGLINSVKSIENKLEEKSKKSHHKKEAIDSSDSQSQQTKEISRKQLQRKLRKKIKKEIKNKKKEKRRRRKLRKKEKKDKKRLKKALKKAGLEENDKAGGQFKNYIQIDNGNNKEIIIPNEQEQEHKISINIDDLDQQENKQKKESKKHKKQKSRHREKREAAQFIFPQNTSVLNMSKLRNRDANQQIKQPINPIDIQSQQIQMQLNKPKKEKKSKKDKKQNKKREIEINNQQILEHEGQKQYYRKLQEIRRQGNIQQARMARISRIKTALKPKQPIILEEDQFNPKYNGQPKYKPFVSQNQFQHKRPRDIFPERLQEISSQCRKIPIIFRQQIPSYKNFDVNGNVVRKISGFNYQQIVLDYPIPNTGKHVLTMRSVVSKRQYTWFGVIDIREKDRQSSYDRKYCIAFSFRTGHVSTNEKWGRQKLGRLPEGTLVSMEVDMDKKSITWHTSSGKNNIASIPKAFQKVTLVPYFQLMDTEDEVYFEQRI